jgi:hypothetical protein
MKEGSMSGDIDCKIRNEKKSSTALMMKRQKRQYKNTENDLPTLEYLKTNFTQALKKCLQN